MVTLKDCNNYIYKTQHILDQSVPLSKILIKTHIEGRNEKLRNILSGSKKAIFVYIVIKSILKSKMSSPRYSNLSLLKFRRCYDLFFSSRKNQILYQYKFIFSYIFMRILYPVSISTDLYDTITVLHFIL